MPLSELLRQTQDRQSALMAHQHVGLAAIQQAVALSDLFDTLVVFENYPVDRKGLAQQAGGLRLGEVQGRDATHYPLALIVQPGEQLQLRLDYRPDLFDRSSIETLGQRLVRLLEAAVADASRPIGSLAILDADERATILQGWNDTAHELPQAVGPAAPTTLPALFAAQAQRTPDAVAVVFEDRELSYAALDAACQPPGAASAEPGRGAQTCWWGCARSARPSWWWGCSAVLKAGGAYVPLDPELSGGAARRA